MYKEACQSIHACVSKNLGWLIYNLGQLMRYIDTILGIRTKDCSKAVCVVVEVLAGWG